MSNHKFFFEELPCGFRYGAATIERVMLDTKRGIAVIRIKTDRHEIDVHITRSGKIRVFDPEGKEWNKPND